MEFLREDCHLYVQLEVRAYKLRSPSGGVVSGLRCPAHYGVDTAYSQSVLCLRILHLRCRNFGVYLIALSLYSSFRARGLVSGTFVQKVLAKLFEVPKI